MLPPAPPSTLPAAASAIAKRLYKTLSVKALSVALSPTVLGELPTNDGNALTFYVLNEYSRTNSLLLEQQTRAGNLPPALSPVQNLGVKESSALIFLTHRRAKSELSPRLLRLIAAVQANPQLTITLIPVTVLWGRNPDKEDSLLKLLMADEWQVPSITKQAFNVGVMGRDTFLQFNAPIDLGALAAELTDTKDGSHLSDGDAGSLDSGNTNNTTSNNTASNNDHTPLAHAINDYLKAQLLKQRTSILGPDLSDRRNITATILRSTDVQTAIAARAQKTGKPYAHIQQEAKNYIDEIASDYSYSVVRVLDRFLTWLWTQLYDGVTVHHFDRVRALAPDYQIVYVPCHRSHMDYLLLSYVIHKHGLRIPHVAAGANLNIPVLGGILRGGGAFFLRRSFKGNRLYSVVFKEYLHNLMRRSAPIEYFIEGGRSRSGRLLSPKLGMLSMTTDSYLSSKTKPVVFIPTYISYERIMEGATYVGELKGKPKETENLWALIKTARKIERIFGTVHLAFGEPLYLDNFLAKFSVMGDNANAAANIQTVDTKAMIANLGIKIMQHINKAAVVNPVSLVALVLLSAPKPALNGKLFLAQLALLVRLATRLRYDNDTQITDKTPAQMLAYARRLRLITQQKDPLGALVAVAKNQAPMLGYFKNNILHVFILPSLIAALVQKNNRLPKAELFAIAKLLYPFFQTELFLHYPQKSLDDTLQDTLLALIDEQLILQQADEILSPNGNSQENQSLAMLGAPAKQSLERYFLALTIMAKHPSGILTISQVVDKCHQIGARLAQIAGDEMPDANDRALFIGFLRTLERMNYITLNGGLIEFDARILTITDYDRRVLNFETRTLITQLAKNDVDTVQKQDRADSASTQKAKQTQGK